MIYNGYFFAAFKLIDKMNQNEDYNSNHNINKEYLFYFAIIIVCKLVSTTIQTHCRMISNLLLNKVFVSINRIIMEKALKRQLKLNKIREISTGEFQNLAQTDALNVATFFSYLYIIPNLTFVLIEALIFLGFLIGKYIWVTISAIIIYFIIYYLLILKVSKCSNKNLIAKENRIKNTADIISNVKEIIINGWRHHFIERIIKLRNIEIKFLLNVMLLKCFIQFLVKAFPKFVYISTFLCYELSDSKISIGNVYLFMIVIYTLISPLYELPDLVNQTILAYSSSERLEQLFDLHDSQETLTISKDYSLDSSILMNFEKLNWNRKDQSIMLKTKQEAKENNFTKNQNTNYNSISENSIEETNSEVRYLNELSQYPEINIKKGELVFIIGGIGSGKSSLFHAFNDELKIIHRKSEIPLKINGKIAYADQSPWILAGTIEENICFLSSYNETKMKKVIKLCELEQDLKQFPNGIKSLCGDQGGNLSGGQKSRISLARAIYSDADIYFLDDPFSSLNKEVADKLIRDCICGFLKSKTVLISSSSTDNLQYADKIILFDELKIKFFGTYREYSQLDYETKNILNAKKEEKVLQIDDTFSYLNLSKQKYQDDIGDNDTLEEDHSTEITKKNQNIYLAYLKNLGGFKYLIICVLLIEGWNILFSVCEFLISRRTLDWDNPTVSSYLKISSVLTLITFFFFYPGSTIFMYQAYKLAKELHHKIVTSLLSTSLAYFYLVPRTGKIMSRLTKDLFYIDQELPLNMIKLIVFLCEVSLTITVIVIGMFWSALIFPIWIIIIISYFREFSFRSRILSNLQERCSSNIFQALKENIRGRTTIGLYSSYEHFLKKFSEITNNYTKCVIHLNGATSYYIIRLNLIHILFTSLILFGSLIQIRIVPSFTLFNLAILYLVSLDAYISPITSVISNIGINIISYQRCLDYTRIPKEKDTLNSIDKKEITLKGNIKFANFSTQYKKDLPFVLKNINLVINIGEKIGIIGRTGSGKSSFFLSLLKIVRPVEGEIYFDGNNIMDLSIDTIRRQITIISQEQNLFIGTLKDNIDPLNYYSEDEIIEAISKTRLHEKLNVEKKKLLEFQIEEYGKNISVGERQLICICRALLKKSPILLIDEVTSSMDVNTEIIIVNLIFELFKECTIISITHHIHSLKNYDKIITFEEGNIKEIREIKEIKKISNTVNKCKKIDNKQR